MIVFGKTKYEKYDKLTVTKCWKELRQRFLPANSMFNDVQLRQITGKLRADFEFKCVAQGCAFGEFALEQLHWMEGGGANTSLPHSVIPVDEWIALMNAETLVVEEVEDFASKEQLNNRHTRRHRVGMELSPNIEGFTLSNIRLFCRQIRVLQQLDSTLILNKQTNLTIADFAIRYLCTVQFKRYLQKNKLFSL